MSFQQTATIFGELFIISNLNENYFLPYFLFTSEKKSCPSWDGMELCVSTSFWTWRVIWKYLHNTLFFGGGGCYWGLHPMKLMDNWLCTQKSILLMLRVPCGDRTQVSCVHDKHISQCSIALTLIFTHWDMEQLRTVRTKFQPSDPGMLIMVGEERPYSPQSYLLGCIWKLDFAFF